MINFNDILKEHIEVIDKQIEHNKPIEIILDEIAIKNLEYNIT